MREILVLSRNAASFARAIQHLTTVDMDMEEGPTGQYILIGSTKYVRFSEQKYRIEGVYSSSKEIYWVEDPYNIQCPPHISMEALQGVGNYRKHLEDIGYKFLGCLEDPESNEYSTKMKNEVFERIG